MEREKAIEVLRRLADGKTEDLYIFDDEGGGVCGQILEEQDAILAGIEALKEKRRYEMVTIKREGDNRLETVLKDNGTQCYYLHTITIEAALLIFGIIELKEEKEEATRSDTREDGT